MGVRLFFAGLMLVWIGLAGCSSSAPEQHGDPALELWPDVCRQVLRAAVASDPERGADLMLPLAPKPSPQTRERLTGFVLAFVGGLRAVLAGRTLAYDRGLPPLRQYGGIMILERWRISDGSEYYLGCALTRQGDDHHLRLSADKSLDKLQAELAAHLRQYAPKGPQSI
jgi:hypothetical protein